MKWNHTCYIAFNNLKHITKVNGNEQPDHNTGCRSVQEVGKNVKSFSDQIHTQKRKKNPVI